MKANLYSLKNPFVFNIQPVSRNEAIRVSHWLARRFKKLGINYYSVGYRGTDTDGYVIEITDRNIIDKITPNPMGSTLPRNR